MHSGCRLHQPPKMLNLFPFICFFFLPPAPSVVRGEQDPPGSVTHHRLKITQTLDESNVTKRKHRDAQQAGAHTQTHTQVRTRLTLAWLNFLHHRQLVVDEHGRAEVSLERSRLMKESRKQNGFFSSHHFLFMGKWIRLI